MAEKNLAAWVLEKRARYTEKMRVLIPKLMEKAEATTLDPGQGIHFLRDQEWSAYKPHVDARNAEKDGAQRYHGARLSLDVQNLGLREHNVPQ